MLHYRGNWRSPYAGHRQQLCCGISVDGSILCVVMSYRDIITIEPDKRGGKPCIRRMRITVYDVLGWLAAGMSMAEIIEDFPELTETDVTACLEFAGDREHR
jgi:uncharacterized protein (DUF433 family)